LAYIHHTSPSSKTGKRGQLTGLPLFEVGQALGRTGSLGDGGIQLEELGGGKGGESASLSAGPVLVQSRVEVLVQVGG
jgi:hypothetical protein